MSISYINFMHPLVKNLLKTFIFSTILAICINSAYYAYKMQGIQYDHIDTVIKIAGATLVLTLILFVLSLPTLFLLVGNFRKHAIVGFLLYFLGPITFIVAFVVMRMDPTDQLFGQLTGLIYLGITTLFYYVLTKNQKKWFK